jgi:GR25 family glycosyltransferase involved in LPS biosynthesis
MPKFSSKFLSSVLSSVSSASDLQHLHFGCQMHTVQMHKMQKSQPNLAEAIGQTFILAYKESTEVLEKTLAQAGLSCEVLRQKDQPEYQHYASIYRCMLNHQQAWIRATQSGQPTLIVEADFVPVSGFGELPLPFKLSQSDVGICWLYTCASQLYSVTTEGFGEGYSTGLVAYIVTPKAAQILCEFVIEITEAHGTGYFNFDSYVDWFLRLHHLKNYIAFRNYGEHGGRPNPEHRRNGMSGIHRADVLYGKLAFKPAYVTASRHPSLHLLLARGQARLKGIARLLLGKFLRPQILRHSTVPWRLVSFAVRRQLCFYKEF